MSLQQLFEWITDASISMVSDGSISDINHSSQYCNDPCVFNALDEMSDVFFDMGNDAGNFMIDSGLWAHYRNKLLLALSNIPEDRLRELPVDSELLLLHDLSSICTRRMPYDAVDSDVFIEHPYLMERYAISCSRYYEFIGDNRTSPWLPPLMDAILRDECHDGTYDIYTDLQIRLALEDIDKHNPGSWGSYSGVSEWVRCRKEFLNARGERGSDISLAHPLTRRLINATKMEVSLNENHNFL